MLGSEGPHTAEGLEERLPFPRTMVERTIHQLEIRNVITIGFFTQTEDAEFILKVDEHRITGGEGDVVEYRSIQNLILDKSFTMYPDIDSAFEAHLLFQKQQELLYRINDFRFNDWKDMQLDVDIVNGRLLQNRQGYTSRRNLPMLLGLKPEPYIGSMEADLLDRIQPDDDIQRTEIIEIGRAHV